MYAKLINQTLEEVEGYVSRIKELLEGFDLYLYGGAVRDSILRRGPTKDFDFLVNDNGRTEEFNERCRNLDELKFSRYGCPKWSPNGLEFDLVAFSNAIWDKSYEGEITVDKVLSRCDLTTSAIAFDLENEIIHDCGALESYEGAEVELLYPGGKPPRQLARIVLHANRLGFGIGAKARAYIKEHYPTTPYEEIKEYLSYKGWDNHTEEVLRALDLLSQSF